MHVVLLPFLPRSVCLSAAAVLPPHPVPLSPEPLVADDVRGGAAGGGPLVSLSDDWTSLAWLLQLEREEVVEEALLA